MTTPEPPPPVDPGATPTAETSGPAEKERAKPPPSRSRAATEDPLRGSRTSGTWIAVVVLLVVLLLLAIFIIQNTGSVEINYFGWTGQAPLSATLLIATVAGGFIAISAAALRIFQLRRRVRRERR